MAVVGVASAAVLVSVLAVPTRSASAQVADGEYRGLIVEVSSFPVAQAFSNEAVIEVFGAGAGIRGRMRVVFGGEITFESRSSPVCFSVGADIPDTAVRGDGASGGAPVTSASADGACSSTSAFEGTTVDDGDFSLAFEGGSRLRGTVTVPGEQPWTIMFSADRVGVIPTTSSTEPVLPGLDAAVLGQSLDLPSLQRIDDISKGCLDGRHRTDPRCFDDDLMEQLLQYSAQRLGMNLVGAHEVNVAIGLATLKDDRGEPLLPSLLPLFPVIVRLHANAISLAADPAAQAEAASALKRLIGLVVALDLGARS